MQGAVDSVELLRHLEQIEVVSVLWEGVVSICLLYAVINNVLR